MSQIRTFFRHCPSCGRRFEIRLESKKLLKDQTVTTRLNASEAAVKDSLIAGPAPPAAPIPTLMGAGEPIIVDIETFHTPTSASIAGTNGRRCARKNAPKNYDKPNTCNALSHV